MSNNKQRKAEGRRQKAAGARSRRLSCCLLLSAFCLLLFGCRQDMQDQPRYEPYESSSFFSDGLSSRRPVEGTVPRGYLRADRQLYTGKMAAGTSAQANANAGGQAGAEAGAQGNANAQAGATGGSNAQGNANATQGNASSQAPAGEADDADTFPFPVTEDVVRRGKERYEIFCSMCHGPTGEGDGMIVRRGYRRPPSYHEDRLRQARVGYLFRVMTEGFGAMPPYRSQIPVQDRWAIAAYIRALQLSQSTLRDAPPAAAAPPAGGQNQTGGHE